MKDCFSFASSAQEKFDEISAYDRQLQGEDIPWTDIPSKLLTEIAKHLKDHIDVTRFRAVCKKWRASLPPPLNSNLLCSLLPYKVSSYSTPLIETSYVPEVHASLCLVASTVYLIQPCDQSLIASKSWLVTLEEMNRGKLFLCLPLRKVAIKALPDNFPKVLSLSGLRVTELSREYNFRYAYNTWGVNSSLDSNSLHKVVLSSSSVLTSNTVGNTIAMVLYGWKGNCVVFPADCLPSYSGSTYPDRRFFRRTIAEFKIGVFHLGESDGAKLVKFYPGYSDLFWPPPAWLQSYACSSSFYRNGLDSPYYRQTEEEEESAQLSEVLDKQSVEYSSTVAQQSL